MANCEGCPVVQLCQTKKLEAEAEIDRVRTTFSLAAQGDQKLHAEVDSDPRLSRDQKESMQAGFDRYGALAKVAEVGLVSVQNNRITIFEAGSQAVRAACAGGPEGGRCISPQRTAIEAKIRTT